MKLFKIFFVAFCMLLFNNAYCAHQLHADSDNVSIPYGTRLEMVMGHDVVSKNVAQGDIFEAHLADDIYVNDKLILPANTVFRGRISGIKYSRMLSRPASLYLSLDHLVTKYGSQLPLNAGVSTVAEYVLKADGAVTTNGNYFTAVKKDAKKSGKIATKGVEWGRNTGDKAFKGARYILIPVGAIGGGIGCAGSAIYNVFADLFRHGDEVIMPKDSRFNIIILQSIQIPS